MIFNDRNKFEQYVNGLGWVEMPCAPGTQYDPNSCQCSLHDSFLPGKRKTFFSCFQFNKASILSEKIDDMAKIIDLSIQILFNQDTSRG